MYFVDTCASMYIKLELEEANEGAGEEMQLKGFVDKSESGTDCYCALV